MHAWVSAFAPVQASTSRGPDLSTDELSLPIGQIILRGRGHIWTGEGLDREIAGEERTAYGRNSQTGP